MGDILYNNNMAYIEIKNVSLRGVAAGVPKKIVKTENLSLFSETEAAKFTNTTGIVERRIADGICTSDLCFSAADQLLNDLGWNRNEVDVLIFASNTRDYNSPATSCILQDRLGLSTSCFTFDMAAACCGFIQGMAAVGSLLSLGAIKKALLLVGDTNSRTSSPEDKSRYPLLGDAGGATAWEYNPNAEPIYTNLLSDGSYYKFVCTPDSGFRNFVTPNSFEVQMCDDGIARAPIHGIMNGVEVFSFAISHCPKAIQNLVERYKINLDKDVDYFLFHQANKKINSIIARKLKIDVSRMPSNIDYFGNTASAAIPLLMVTNIADQLRSSYQRLLLSAIGAGFVYGGGYLVTDNIIVSNLIEI